MNQVAGDLAIEVHGLSKRFGDKVVVDNVDLAVPRGRIMGFLGPNGSGKTTTIRMLCGLLHPDAGEGTCLGFNLRTQAREIKRRVGYMTQRFSLYEDLSISENLQFIARMYDVPARQQAVEDALQQLGLQSRAKQLAGSLSGGWKQRLALAGCLLHKPQLLLLDEPTAGVDPKARREFWDRIHVLAAQGMTVLVSTHYMDEAERCHALAYIAYGKLLANGTAAEVIQQAGLHTWSVSGESLNRLAEDLRKLPDIDMVVPFGTALHVSGVNADALLAAIAPYRTRADLNWVPIQPSLEDAFIRFMQGGADNYP